MRAIVDIDDSILREVKAINKKEGGSLGAVVSALLADALALSRTKRSPHTFRWISRAMNARLDLADKHALHGALDGRAGISYSIDINVLLHASDRSSNQGKAARRFVDEPICSEHYEAIRAEIKPVT